MRMMSHSYLSTLLYRVTWDGSFSGQAEHTNSLLGLNLTQLLTFWRKCQQGEQQKKLFRELDSTGAQVRVVRNLHLWSSSRCQRANEAKQRHCVNTHHGMKDLPSIKHDCHVSESRSAPARYKIYDTHEARDRIHRAPRVRYKDIARAWASWNNTVA